MAPDTTVLHGAKDYVAMPQTDGGADFSLVVIGDMDKPSCRDHGAMNKVTLSPPGFWRCLQGQCRAGCQEAGAGLSTLYEQYKEARERQTIRSVEVTPFVSPDFDREAAVQRCKTAWIDHWNNTHVKIGKPWGGKCCIEMAVTAVTGLRAGKDVI